MGRLVMKVRLRDKSGIRLYRYVVEDVDRHGNVRIYFRRKGQPKIRFTEMPGTAAFDAEYQRAFSGELKCRSEPANCLLCRGPCGGCASNITRPPPSNCWRRPPAKSVGESLKIFVGAPAFPVRDSSGNAVCFQAVTFGANSCRSPVRERTAAVDPKPT